MTEQEYQTYHQTLNAQHKVDCKKRMDSGKITTYENLSDVSESSLKLKIGQKVAFTNSYGVVFTGHEILGFVKPTRLTGGCVLLDYDCYWFPAKVESLTIE